jgi:CMP-N-acetylneuraminic acid synthetase
MVSEVLAIIPARGGSKSIPRKNIISLTGHPLIAYSIAAGLAAETVTRTIVSTDDEEIAAISRKYGAETPFLRPSELSQDDTPDLPVFEHALKWLSEQEGYAPEIVVQLRPTSPFRRVWHIDLAVYRLLERPEADSVRTVCIPFQNPFKMWKIDPDGFMHPLAAKIEPAFPEMLPESLEISPVEESCSEPYNMPRQLLPEVYWQTGYVDVTWSDTILEKKTMTGQRILPLIINPNEWIDIDSPADWRRAERMMESGELTFEDLGFQFK